MCKWIINYRLLSAILLTQMFRRRDSEQKGRIPLCGVILTVNSSPQHKLFPVFSPQALLAAAPSPGASAAPPVLLLHSCTHQPGSGGCAQREIENYSSFFQALKGTSEKGDFPSYLWKTNPGVASAARCKTRPWCCQVPLTFSRGAFIHLKHCSR